MCHGNGIGGNVPSGFTVWLESGLPMWRCSQAWIQWPAAISTSTKASPFQASKQQSYIWEVEHNRSKLTWAEISLEHGPTPRQHPPQPRPPKPAAPKGPAPATPASPAEPKGPAHPATATGPPTKRIRVVPAVEIWWLFRSCLFFQKKTSCSYWVLLDLRGCWWGPTMHHFGSCRGQGRQWPYHGFDRSAEWGQCRTCPCCSFLWSAQSVWHLWLQKYIYMCCLKSFLFWNCCFWWCSVATESTNEIMARQLGCIFSQWVSWWELLSPHVACLSYRTHCCFLGVVAAFQALPLVSKNCLRRRASEPAPAVVTFWHYTKNKFIDEGGGGGWGGGIIASFAVCSHALAHIRHATLLYVLMHLHTYVMLRCCTFSCSCTHTSSPQWSTCRWWWWWWWNCSWC